MSSGINKHKIIFVGDSFVGKTAIIGTYMTGDFTMGYDQTIGTDFSTKTMTVNNKSVQLQIWDTAGSERYIRDSAVAVVVYNIGDRKSFENVDKWIEDIHAVVKNEIILFIVGNKLDLGGREVTQKEALAKAQNYGCECFETSAKTNVNIVELFTAITEKLLSLNVPSLPDPPVVSLDEPRKSSTCC